MSGCPYTWFKGLFAQSNKNGLANCLRVTVSREKSTVVDVSLPAKSAGWLMELIPDEVITKIKAEGIPLEAIQADLAAKEQLVPQKIFSLDEEHRSVTVWLE